MCNCPKCRNKIDEELFQQFIDAIRNNAPQKDIAVIIEKIRNAKPKTILLEVSDRHIGNAVDRINENYWKLC
jgi:hypothetical protein